MLSPSNHATRRSRALGLFLLFFISAVSACRKEEVSAPPPVRTCEQTIVLAQGSSDIERASHVYNEAGELVRVGRGYDANSIEYRNITRGQRFLVLVPAPGRLGVDSIAFDDQNRVVAHREYFGSPSDPVGWRQRTYIYDANGDLTSEYHTQSPAAGTDSLYLITYEWENGNLIRRTSSDLSVTLFFTEYMYDSVSAGEALHPADLLEYLKTGVRRIKTRNRVTKTRRFANGSHFETGYFSYEDGVGDLHLKMQVTDSADANNTGAVRVSRPCR